MIKLLIITALFGLGAAFNWIMDSIEDKTHFDESPFKSKNPKFWLKSAAWQAKRLPFTKYPWNAWHIAKSGMIFSFAIAVALATGQWMLFVSAGVSWNLVFNYLWNRK